MDADGSNQRRLTDNEGVDSYPAWSPDGTQIATASGKDGNMEIYVMALPDGTDTDGSDLRRLTDDPADDLNPS
jgi:TolB protein